MSADLDDHIARFERTASLLARLKALNECLDIADGEVNVADISRRISSLIRAMIAEEATP